MKTKQYIAKDVQVDPDARTVVAVISTDSVDRDGEVVLPSGLEKKSYNGNPIVLYGHDSSTLPIGKTLWVKTDGKQVIAKYRITDKTQFARDVFGLMQDGVLSAHSIGFLDKDASPPTTKELEQRPDWKECRRVIRSWELLEFSVVPIPCNPDALALSVAKCSRDTLAFLGKSWEPAAEETDCCQWPEIEEAPAEEKPAVIIPKYCRRIDRRKEREARIDQLLREHSADEILARLYGRA